MGKKPYHLVFCIIIGNLNHGDRIFEPRSSGLHESRPRKPFGKALEDGEKVDRECARYSGGVKIGICLFDKIDKRVVSFFPNVNTICQLQDYPAS